jgi:hypothetical protein
MTFDGVDILTQGSDEETVSRVLSLCLSVPRDLVLVVDGIAHDEDALRAAERSTVVCERTRVRGEFPLLLSVNCHPMELPYEETVELVQVFADGVGTRCLVGTDSPDPFEMWLVSPDLSPQLVSLDADAMDRDEYVIGKP